MKPQDRYLPVISQSDGSAFSGSRILKERFQRKSSSAKKMEKAVIAHMITPRNQNHQSPRCVSSGELTSATASARDGSGGEESCSLIKNGSVTNTMGPSVTGSSALFS